ncbi:MAG: hypothetical protein K2M89_00740 [Clostridiales bacterium]|nr:hypothetical protein [Clostridiales bacterium]
MYCVKCGKQTNGDETLCQDCKAAEKTVDTVKPVPSDPNQPNTSMLSFGKALASTIMGFGAFILSNVLNSGGWGMKLISMIFMVIIDVAVIVLSIVFGSLSIRTYSTFKSGGNKKPIPAFILGIIGVILAGIATVITLVFLLVDLPAIA